MNKFRNLILIIIFLSVKPLSIFAQFTLTIEINDLQNNKGHILLELYNENETKIKGITQAIVNNKCIIAIENLKPAKYGFKYFHDENNNENLDKNWIGIPIEGYGFSNNAKGTFGPPSFEETLFEIKNTTEIKCKLTYLFD